MLKPGEKVVAAINHRDRILIFGDRGTVLIMTWSEEGGYYFIHNEMEIAG